MRIREGRLARARRDWFGGSRWLELAMEMMLDSVLERNAEVWGQWKPFGVDVRGVGCGERRAGGTALVRSREASETVLSVGVDGGGGSVGVCERLLARRPTNGDARRWRQWLPGWRRPERVVGTVW
uniref:Uncharacterized protein n=1 Tax=Mycena chlorophos TaxID=658473 RepID=A0ABQ0M0J4_MYCCL|nr:predicted protein [Mycena chlorophos]